MTPARGVAGGSKPEKRDGEKGLAMVEFMLMLPLVVIFMMFLVVSYDFMDEIMDAQYRARHEVRKRIDSGSQGPSKKVAFSKTASVGVPPIVRKVVGKARLNRTEKIVAYTGCYQGQGKNIFRNRRRTRTISY